MICTLTMPALSAHMTTGLIECIYPTNAGELKLGSKFVDVSVDLGAAFAQECPPISYYRIILRERAWLRRVCVEVGKNYEVGAVLAILTTTPDEDLEGVPERDIRVASAGVIYHDGMWSGAI